MKSLDGVSVSVMVLLAAFAVDRLVSGILFLLCMAKLLPDPSHEAAGDAGAARKYRLAYVVFAAVLSTFLLIAYPNVRIMAALGRAGGTAFDGFFDTLLTAIVYIGGADRIASLLKGSSDSPVAVSGQLELAPPAPGGDRQAGASAP